MASSSVASEVGDLAQALEPSTAHLPGVADPETLLGRVGFVVGLTVAIPVHRPVSTTSFDGAIAELVS